MIRLFIALKIPEEIKDKIFGYCFDAIENAVGYKWEAKDKVHLTLKFIGEVKGRTAAAELLMRLNL